MKDQGFHHVGEFGYIFLLFFFVENFFQRHPFLGGGFFVESGDFEFFAFLNYGLFVGEKHVCDF